MYVCVQGGGEGEGEGEGEGGRNEHCCSALAAFVSEASPSPIECLFKQATDICIRS